MIIYLAGPMTGLPEHNYPAFADAAAKLRGRGMEVRSPHEIDGGSMDRSWDWYMRAAIAMLLGCEKIVLLPGWKDSRGARLERKIAEELGMPVSLYTEQGLIPVHLAEVAR